MLGCWLQTRRQTDKNNTQNTVLISVLPDNQTGPDKDQVTKQRGAHVFHVASALPVPCQSLCLAGPSFIVQYYCGNRTIDINANMP